MFAGYEGDLDKNEEDDNSKEDNQCQVIWNCCW